MNRIDDQLHAERARIVARSVQEFARHFGTTRPGTNHRGVGRMSIHTSDIVDHKRLDVARTLYNALVAQHPDRPITLCDGSGRVVARSERRPNEDAAEEASS